jgi:hypothetical protein
VSAKPRRFTNVCERPRERPQRRNDRLGRRADSGYEKQEGSKAERKD